MYYRCYNTECPENLDAPCELDYMEMIKMVGCITACPIGEEDGFLDCEEGSEFFCLIISNQSFNNYELLVEKADKLLEVQVKNRMQINIVSGEDPLVEKYAKERRYRFIQFKADSDTGEKSVCHRRMLKFISNMVSEHDAKCGVIAFWDGQCKEIAQALSLAEKYGVPSRVIKFH